LGRVLQVVGYQNSGKTTFVVDYIKEAVKRDLRVGTIKHHGHAGALEFNDSHKDTGKHRQAGAHVSIVDGNGSFVLTSEKLSLTLSQMLSMYTQFDLDMIVVEGFKSATYPKVVLMRSQEDLPILDELLNICCIITRLDLPIEVSKKYKIFQNQEESIEWLITHKVGEGIE
jgi:molybdopterin-guanine dinucleotide biosynthesis protein B